MSDSEPAEELLERAEEEQEADTARDQDGSNGKPDDDAEVVTDEQLGSHADEAEEEEIGEQDAQETEQSDDKDQGISNWQPDQHDEEGLELGLTANEENAGVDVKNEVNAADLNEEDAAVSADNEGSPPGADRAASGFGQLDDVNLYPEPDNDDPVNNTEIIPSEVDAGGELVVGHSKFYDPNLQQQHQVIPTPPPLLYESEDTTTINDEDVSPCILVSCLCHEEILIVCAFNFYSYLVNIVSKLAIISTDTYTQVQASSICRLREKNVDTFF